MDTPAHDVPARLYEAHRSAVFGTCLGLLGSPEEAADATQEVFAKALPVIAEVRHPRAWLQTAARHHCTDILRRRRLAERTVAPDWGVERESPDPAEVVERRQVAALTMGSLPPRERRALAHAFLEDAPLGKVAACMGLSYAATVQLISRARRRAAHLGNLPSAVVVPKLAQVARMVTRAPVAQTVAGGPRAPAAGGALLLCVSLLCSSPSPRSAPDAAMPHAATARSGAAAATPSAGGSPAPVALAVPVPLPPAPRLGGAVKPGEVVHPSPPACTAVPYATPTELWTHAATTPSPTSASPPPQLRLTSEVMQVNASTLVIQLHVVDMEQSVPAGSTAMDWATEWAMGTQRYEASAAYGTNSGAAYHAGLAGKASLPVTGSLVTGANGYVELDVPLSVAGNPSPGWVLAGATAWTGQTALSTTNGPSLMETQVDSAGPGRDVTVGQRCA